MYKITNGYSENLRRNGRNPICVGMVPAIFKPCVVGPSKLSTSSESIFPTSDGIVPVIKLFDKITSRMNGNVPSSVGKKPVRKLLDKSSTCNAAISPTLVGKAPSKLFPSIAKVAKEEKRKKKIVSVNKLGRDENRKSKKCKCQLTQSRQRTNFRWQVSDSIIS